MNLQVVEVEYEFKVQDYPVRPGARVMAWRQSHDGWMVFFNGNNVPVPPGTVHPLGAAPPEKKRVELYSPARQEQYQLATAARRPQS